MDDEGMEASQLIDGSLTTAYAAKNDDAFHWVQFDFGKALKVCDTS